MFGIGTTELVLFFVIVLIAVGPDRLPTFMRAVGKGLREIRRASREFRDAIGLDDLMREDPFKTPPRVRPPPIPPSERPAPVVELVGDAELRDPKAPAEVDKDATPGTATESEAPKS